MSEVVHELLGIKVRYCGKSGANIKKLISYLACPC